MSSIAAPVVPTQEAITVPTARSAVFAAGVARSVPRTWMPPPMVNSVAIRMTNGRYSARAV